MKNLNSRKTLGALLMKSISISCITLLLCSGLLLLAPPGAMATITTFSDRAAFITATGAGAAGTVPTGGGAEVSFVMGDLTFTRHAPSSFFLIPGDLGIRIPGFDLAINGFESFNVDSGTLLSSFGFDFHEVEFDPNLAGTFLESTFEVTLRNGGSFVDSFTFTRPNDSLEFVGVGSTNSFDRIEIREIVGGFENEFFGNFLTTTASVAVPEPSTLVLFGPAMMGLVGYRRYRKRFATQA